jgi:hypothetical protein
LHIANKLLGRQNLNFDQLTPPEQKLWNLVENSDIYEFLTSDKDTIPEFRHNWITCSAKPKVTLDYQGFLNSWAAFNQQPQPQQQPVVQRALSDPSPIHHNLRERKIESTTGLFILGKNYDKFLKNLILTFNKQLSKSNQNAK